MRSACLAAVALGLAISGCSGGSSSSGSGSWGVTPAALQYPIVGTGQVECYNALALITCPAPGQAFYGQDAQFTSAPPSYTLSPDGKTVLDNVTGLTWMRGPNTTLAPPAQSDKLSFSQFPAWVIHVNALQYGGYKDWRLPTIKELYSLINFTGLDPSGYTGTDTSLLTPFINTDYFNFAYGQVSAGVRLIDAQYGSSTVYVVNPGANGNEQIFGVNFADGRIKAYDVPPSGSTSPPPSGELLFFVQLVRGPTTYGSNYLIDNGNSRVTDTQTGLMWSQGDSGTALTWQAALAWVQTKNAANYLAHNDWRLPTSKELHSIVDYSNAPDYNGRPAIDTTKFTCTAITNENGDADFPYYWTSTTHAAYTDDGEADNEAAYVAFGRALGWSATQDQWIDWHGAGAQRADPKTGPPFPYATVHTIVKDGVTYTGYAFGPENDAIRGLNYVRLVRDAN
jgi:hypothetical protein